MKSESQSLPPFVSPISRVFVANQTGDAILVRMNWPDGILQAYEIAPGTTQWLSGATGTSGFPRTIDVLDADCRVVRSVRGLQPGNTGLVTFEEDAARIQPIEIARTEWTPARSLDICESAS